MKTRRSRPGRALGALLASLVALLLVPSLASAAEFTVKTTDDEADPAGCAAANPDCSLREAIAAANADVAPDEIVVPAGTYVLTQGELAITTPVTVEGAGARAVSVDGNEASRVFNISTAPLDGETTISGLTVTGGLSSLTDAGDMPGDGGGVLLNGSPVVNLVRVAISGNSAMAGGGGVAAPLEGPGATLATLRIERSTLSDNTVMGNTADGQGGAILTSGPTEIVNSTITENTVGQADMMGAAFSNRGGGIGIVPDVSTTGTVTVRLVNTTLTGNAVTTQNGAPMSMGGGIATADPLAGGGPLTRLEVVNSIVAENTVDGTTDNCGGPGAMPGMGSGLEATVSDSNLTDDPSCGFPEDGPDASIVAAPLLRGLADNGGPTDTLLPTRSSPAVDNADPDLCPATDQRGLERPQGSGCDIGSVEIEMRSDLVARLAASPKRPPVGSRLTYRLTARNAGPTPARGTTLIAKLPAKAGKVTGAGCRKSNRGRKLTCRVGSLAAGGSAARRVAIEVPRERRITARLNVRSKVEDPNRVNNKRKLVTRTKRG